MGMIFFETSSGNIIGGLFGATEDFKGITNLSYVQGSKINCYNAYILLIGNL